MVLGISNITHVNELKTEPTHIIITFAMCIYLYIFTQTMSKTKSVKSVHIYYHLECVFLHNANKKMHFESLHPMSPVKNLNIVISL